MTYITFIFAFSGKHEEDSLHENLALTSINNNT